MAEIFKLSNNKINVKQNVCPNNFRTGVWTTNGVGGTDVSVNETYRAIDFEVLPNTTYTLTRFVTEYTFLMNGNNAINNFKAAYSIADAFADNYTFITPSNCNRICLSILGVDAEITMCVNDTILPVEYKDGLYERYVEKLFTPNNVSINDMVDTLGVNNTKRAVWFGTSIPAGGYPQIVANKLGIKIYNEAVASSCVRAGYHGLVNTEDPLGQNQSNDYPSMLAENTLRALSSSVAEKQVLYTRWSRSDPQETWEEYLNCSYDRKLDKYLSGGSVGQVDYYIFDHGHNDRIVNGGGGTPNDMIVEPSVWNDRTYFIGAMNFILNRILTDNPHAKIIFIGHYEIDRKSEIAEAQKIIAEKWGFPLIPLWEYTGFTQQAVNLKKKWVNGYLVDDTTYNLFRITQTWMADDLHPSSDLSGKCNEHLATILAKKLANVMF